MLIALCVLYLWRLPYILWRLLYILWRLICFVKTLIYIVFPFVKSLGDRCMWCVSLMEVCSYVFLQDLRIFCILLAEPSSKVSFIFNLRSIISKTFSCSSLVLFYVPCVFWWVLKSSCFFSPYFCFYFLSGGPRERPRGGLEGRRVPPGPWPREDF